MGKVVLVTGASSGLGLNMAEALAAGGHRVYGTSRAGQGPGRNVAMLALDVCDQQSVEACVAAVLAAEGRIDLLVNNAGYGIFGALADVTLDEAQAQFDTNFWGVVRMNRAVLPAMLAAGSGRIITVGSMAGHIGLPFQGFYSASKFALEGLNEALRLELMGTGVDATMICPGDFATGFTAARRFAAASSPRFAERLRRALAIYERDELKGADPALVAALVCRLAEARRVGVRHFVGSPGQRLQMFIRHLVPARWFEEGVRRSYDI